ncbi:MAG: CvpA family protein [Ekhidna sp.]|uniref:CvpA family protein n=1 Tax=Ekhidna sp. TaxID=2608089 RepID=UPI0032F03EF7
MGTFDIIILILLILGGVKGYQNGFIVELLSFLAFFIGLFLALELTVPVSVGLFGESSYFDVAAILVFFGLFLLLTLAIKAGAKALKNMVDMTIFGSLDNLVGAFAGAFKAAFIISIIFWVFESVGFDLIERYADDTFIFPYIVHIGPTVFGWLSEVIPFIRDLIDSMDQMPKGKDTYITAI